ncbi:MAG: 1-acyl-sn-glycerol-3-phosphate acyltransferase, partial [Acidobacteria bacterium]|nr:1-acyl-sn-glycerol-3-phosphate acyltransferase [Acidobacteriota bacterium]
PLKRELIWVPFAGFAWWALDFPFMSRHSEQFLAEHPERRGEDLAAIRKACEKFRLVPTTLANFVEGTRFTPEKHDARSSEYRHLLRPRAGGLALALDSMGEQFESLIDVTIFYPGGAPTFFEFLAGETGQVVVLVKERPIPRDAIGGDYARDRDYRETVHGWVNGLWTEKDKMLEELQRESSDMHSRNHEH